MENRIKALKSVRANIKAIEKIIKTDGKKRKSQIFIQFKEGCENEAYKSVSVSDYGCGEGDFLPAYNIYKIMLDELKEQEKLYLSMLKTDLKELEEELSK